MIIYFSRELFSCIGHIFAFVTWRKGSLNGKIVVPKDIINIVKDIRLILLNIKDHRVEYCNKLKYGSRYFSQKGSDVTFCCTHMLFYSIFSVWKKKKKRREDEQICILFFRSNEWQMADFRSSLYSFMVSYHFVGCIFKCLTFKGILTYDLNTFKGILTYDFSKLYECSYDFWSESFLFICIFFSTRFFISLQNFSNFGIYKHIDYLSVLSILMNAICYQLGDV